MSKVFISHSRTVAGKRLDPEYHYALASIRIESPYPCVKLLSLAYFKTGGTPSTINGEYWGGTLPWVSAKDFKEFRFEDSEDHITELAAEEATTYVVDKPALLMVSRSGILQHSLPVMVTYRRAAINQDIKAFFPDSRVSVDYLGAYFDLLGKRLLPLLCKSGATVQSINTNELMNLQVPVPPIEVQRRLVAELDAAYAAKRTADEKAIKLLASIDDMVLKELGIAKLPKPDTSLSSRIFTVPAREALNGRLDSYSYSPFFADNLKRIRVSGSWRLGELVTLSHRQWDQREWQNGAAMDFPYIEIGTISVDDGIVGRVENVPIVDAPSRARMMVESGDLLVSLTRPTRRAIAFATEEAIASTGFAVIHGFSHEVMPEYLSVILRSELCAYQFDQRSTGGNYPAITEEQLLQCEIPMASKVHQSQIVANVSSIHDEVRKLKADATAELEAAKRMIEEKLVRTED